MFALTRVVVRALARVQAYEASEALMQEELARRAEVEMKLRAEAEARKRAEAEDKRYVSANITV